MTKLFLKQISSRLLSITFLIIISNGNVKAGGPIIGDQKRAEEIRQEMWYSNDPEFSVTEIPEKWSDESAVYIAKTNYLTYSKAVLISELTNNRFSHNRIKLLDKAAVENYSQFSFAESKYYNGIHYDIYPGFKIIKPDGKEIVVSLTEAVKQELEVGRSGFNYYKLAIPNLEIGDIIDYYIVEERKINTSSKFYSFDAVIFQLNEEYPIMYQKISFDVLRRCYINLKTSNGAPDFKLTEDYKGDKNQYSLVDRDRESIEDLRWFFPNRQLPTVKFKVSYASAMVASATPAFLGEAGQLKSSVSKSEVEKLIKYSVSGGIYLGATLKSYMKSNFKKEKDLDKLAREAFYAYRNQRKASYAEAKALDEVYETSSISLSDIASLSYYYKSKKIPHSIIIGVPRQISNLDDMILENELSPMLRVDTKNPFYISEFSSYSTTGTIDPDLQGTKAYAFDGNLSSYDWTSSKTDIPVQTYESNMTKVENQISFTDLDNDEIKMSATKVIVGNNKFYYQNRYMDYYSFQEEEKLKYEEMDGLDKFSRSYQKELKQKKINYFDTRDKKFNDLLKEELESDFDLKVEEVENLKIVSSGRFENNKNFIFQFDVKFNGAIKKVGKNYLIDLGKFIEQQISLKEEEKSREYDIYQPFARSFFYNLTIDIPEGYSAQGIESFIINKENETGGFISTAELNGNKLIITTKKLYKLNFVDQSKWPLMVEFLDAANDFTQQKLLLKKI